MVAIKLFLVSAAILALSEIAHGAEIQSKLGLTTVQGVPHLVSLQTFINTVLHQLFTPNEAERAIRFSNTNQFKQMMAVVENQPEVLNLLHFLDIHGLEASLTVNAFNYIFGIPLAQQNGRGKRSYDYPGVFVQHKILIAPEFHEYLRNYRNHYNQKLLRASRNYQNLHSFFTSYELRYLIDAAWSNPTVRSLIDQLYLQGIDVQYVTSVIDLLWFHS